ncbi:MAG: response regulator [Chitinophagaceae bacterium]
MSTLKIGIVEDEVIIADNIANILVKLGYEVAEPVGSYAEAIQMIEDENPDLLLLDIHIRGKKDGIDLAEKIKEAYHLPVIFLTANSDIATVERAKKTGPASYLIKPFTKDDLYSAIEIAIHNSNASRFGSNRVPGNGEAFIARDSIFIKDGQLYNKVKVSDILYFESEHVYVNVYTFDKTYLVRTSLQDYLAQFDTEKFFRIHRSYIVNLEFIQTVHPEYVIINGVRLPVGKSYRMQLFGRLRI